MSALAQTTGAAPATGSDWKIYGLLAAMYAPIIYPILRANSYYEDDFKRALTGHQGWDATGRPLTTLLMRMLQCYDRAMVDISPFPQMAAIALLAWLGVLIARRFAIRSVWMASLAAFPLGAQPFFLENLSYRFDALSMALAMFFVLLPIVRPGSGRRGWWLGVLWLFLALSLYQPAINAFLVFMLFEAQWTMAHEQSFPSLRRNTLARVAQVAVGMLLYELIIGMPMINGWVKRNSQKIHHLDELLQLPANIASYFRFIGDSFNPQWWVYFSPVLLVMALLSASIGVRYAWLEYRKRPPAWPAAVLLLVTILLPLIALLCLFGPMLALVKPVLQPRVLLGVGAWLSTGLLGMYFMLEARRQSPRWALAAGWMLAIGMMVIAGSYGNALSAQTRYEEAIAGRLADDYAGVQAEAGAKALLFDGSAGFAPVTRHAIGQFPLLEVLIASHLKAIDNFRTAPFLAHYMPGAAYIAYLDDEDGQASSRIRSVLAQTCGLKPLKVTASYEMYVSSHAAVVIFRQGSARRCDLPEDTAVDDIARDAKPLLVPF